MTNDNDLTPSNAVKGTIDLIVSEGDHVAAKTPMAGARDSEPSETGIANFWQVADGKLVEQW